MMHLLVTIAAHGYGHLSQTAPILNRLHARLPALRLTVVSQLSLGVLQQQIRAPFEHIHMETEVGMRMGDALSVDREASIEAYRQQRHQWNELLEAYRTVLRKLSPDVLLSNISYLSLAAARREGVPGIALCSINWADILEGYTQGAEFDELVEPIREAYQQAELFLQCQPHMPMEWLENRRSIGVIARRGHEHRQELLGAVGEAYERIVLVSLGGVDFTYEQRHLPAGEGILWVLQGRQPAKAVDVITTHDSGLPFIDIVASADAWVSKPGYGSFTEAAVHKTPVLYLERDQWPEETALVQWLGQYGVCAPLNRETWEQGRTLDVLEELWRQEPPPPPGVDGIEEAVEALFVRLATQEMD